MTGSLTTCRTPGTPALMHAPPATPTQPGARLNPSPPPTSSAERRQPQGPTAADAVALRASLDPRRLPRHARPDAKKAHPRSPTPLTHAAPSGMDSLT